MSGRRNRSRRLPTQTGEDMASNQLPRSGAAQNQNQGGGGGGDQSGHMPPLPPPEFMAMLEEQNQLLETTVNSFDNHQPSSPPRTNRMVDMFEELHLLNTPEFAGGGDFIEADYWLREVEMKLDCVHRADEKDRVTLATLLLKGASLFWWDSYCKANPRCIMEFKREEFVRVFRDEHIPRCIMEFKREEFVSLRQGGMTVTEYLHRFTELARYAPEYVSTDETKQEAFRRGLNPGLKVFVDGSIHEDFNALVNRAIFAEINKEIRKQRRRKC